jgi:ABC-2 type transport system ATP-binding protein
MATQPLSAAITDGRRQSPSAPPAIVAVGVRMSFGSNVVLDGVDLTVAEGTVFALLGPNGAGKTTMVNILATLLEPDDGEIRVAGHDLATDPDGVRRAIGVTGQFSAVDNLLTGEENLRLIADLRHFGRDAGRRRVSQLLERFDLLDAARKPVATYSGGMKRRLDLAMTLLGDPRLIFLDEPTTGLDPRSRRTMWDVIGELVADGVTIFLTTQYLDEADRLADAIAILDNGRIVAQGSPDELKRNLPGGHIQLQFADAQSMISAARHLDTGPGDPDTLTLQVPGDSSITSLRALLDGLDRAGIGAERLSIHEADLDDVFLTLTGHPTAEPDLQA